MRRKSSAPKAGPDIPGQIVKLTALKFVGTTILVVAVGGVLATILYPANAERIWLALGPLISTAIGSMLFGGVRTAK